MLKNVNKRLAVLAYRILVITRPLVCILLFQLLTQYLSTKWDKLASLDKPNFTLICWYLVTYFNSFTNAVAFEVTFNRSKEKVILFFKGNTLNKFNRENNVNVN